MDKELFAKAIKAGGDSGDRHIEKLFKSEPEGTVCDNLDNLMVVALKGNTPKSDLSYCIRNLQSALNVLDNHKTNEDE